MGILLTVGIAHRDASLEQLEQVAVTPRARAELQRRALSFGCAEVMVLSTCSRTEVHAILDVDSVDDAATRRECWAVADRLVAALISPTGQPRCRVGVVIGDDAVRRLFRVAAGLESRIVGETEVQAQLRLAARTAVACGQEPHRLRRVVSAAVSAARATAAERSDLLRRGLLAERAVARALSGVAHPEVLDAVVVGAGTMGRQIAEALPRGRCRTALLSRTSSARQGHGPAVHGLDELPQRLRTADLVFVATSAGRQILSAALVRGVLAERADRPLTIVDLSLPRNVDPDVVAVPGVRLLDLDDLADRASGARPDPCAVAAVERAVDVASQSYCADIRSRRAGPIIGELRANVEDACLLQLRRTARGLGLTEDQLNRMAAAVAGAVVHGPTVLARQAAADDDQEALAVLADAFRLDVRPERVLRPA